MDKCDLTGNRFGRLLVLGKRENRNGRAVWFCACDCGASTIVSENNLKTGRTKSCGCLQADITSQRNFKHGHSRTPLYKVWAGMRARCMVKTCTDYDLYGGRGITVCPEWKDFEAFRRDMGDRPSKRHSIDRIDPNGNYEPSNCRWATPEQQAQNQRIRHDNKSGITGVRQIDGGAWRVSVRRDGVTILDKCFKTKDEAMFARESALNAYRADEASSSTRTAS